MVIVDTCLRHDIDKAMFKAFMHGQIHGKYKLYKDLDSGKLSIRFDTEEDGTVFKLKTLDEVYAKDFDRSRDSKLFERNGDDLRKYINTMRGSSNPFGGTGSTY